MAGKTRKGKEKEESAGEQKAARKQDAAKDVDEVMDDDLLDEDVEFESETSWEEIAEDPELMSRILESLGGVVPGIFKRVAVSGVGNLLLSEDGIRTLLAENKKLPKEAVSLLVGQADVMRREVLRIISKEIRVFLENMDFGGEIAKILTSVSFEIKTEIRFIPNDQAVKPSVKNKIKARRNKDKEREKEEEPDVDDDDDEGLDGLSELSEASEASEGRDRSAAGLVRKLTWGRRKKESAPVEDAPDEE